MGTKSIKSNAGFFGMHRSLGLLMSVATLVASSAGVWILFSPVETISWAGVSGLLGYALGQALPLLLIAFIGLRMLRALPAESSLPKWAELRYGRIMGFVCLLISLFYLTVFLAAELTAIGKAGALLTPLPGWTIVALITFLTWTYTNRGGFRLVVLTDLLQLSILIPILLVIFGVAIYSSPRPLLSNIIADEPQLLSLSFVPGLKFAATLIIAIVAAQVFNQSLWQRVYAARDDVTMRNAFIIAGLLMIPLVLACGYLGLLARDAQVGLEDPEVGIFALLLEYDALWLVAGLGIAALLLVMSSADSILNALSSLVSEELGRHKDAKATSVSPDSNQVSRARWITSGFAIVIALIASQGWSVLYLFLIADLVCAAAVVPIFIGLYNNRIHQFGACISIGLGLVCGILFMLRPDLSTPLISNPIGSSWLLSFSSALLISSFSALAFIWVGSRNKVSLKSS